MPKVVGEIKTFSIGIVSTVDEHDIPADASQYNENIETLNTDGKLKGRRRDVSLLKGEVVSPVFTFHETGGSVE